MSPQVLSVLAKWDRVFDAMSKDRTSSEIRREVYRASKTDNPTKELGQDMRKLHQAMAQYK